MKTKADIILSNFTQRALSQIVQGQIYKTAITGSLYFTDRMEPKFLDRPTVIIHIEQRSYNQLKTYFWVLLWLEMNIKIENGFFDNLTAQTWHTEFKNHFNIESIKHSELDQPEFNTYCQNVFELVEIKTGSGVDDIIGVMSQLSEEYLRERQRAFKL